MATAIQTPHEIPMPATAPKAAPMADAGSQNGNSGTAPTGSATITANDFLTLLVTEMKNQDPTANTDPNEYINQLVQVNSLQQLISINEVLTSSLGTPNTTDPTTQSAGTPHVPRTPVAANAAQSGLPVPAAEPAPSTQGNLSLPASSGAAQRLSHALDGLNAAGAGSRTQMR